MLTQRWNSTNLISIITAITRPVSILIWLGQTTSKREADMVRFQEKVDCRMA